MLCCVSNLTHYNTSVYHVCALTMLLLRLLMRLLRLVLLGLLLLRLLMRLLRLRTRLVWLGLFLIDTSTLFVAPCFICIKIIYS